MTASTTPSPGRLKGDALMRRFPWLKQFFANPVVIRDLRAQMRGARSYWYIGGYLLLLGVLAIAGYAQATGQAFYTGSGSFTMPRNIVDAQGHLEGFYGFIFYTLAALITLIAPALTASSIVGERQRQSFDLLVTTPLTANHLLIGKLLSSIAFLGMLLILSLPASALCILLGGATLTDVFRVYFLLAVDGIVLAAIGLYFSCAVRVPILATVWTYGSVIGFLYITLVTAQAGAHGQNFPTGTTLALAWLNPFIAVTPVTGEASSAWTTFLRLLAFVGVAALLLRLLLTAATYRLGLYGGQSGVSLRKQALFGVALIGLMMSDGISRSTMDRLGRQPDMAEWFGYFLLTALAIVMPFLPALFVPATAENAPPGAAADAADEPARHRLFRARRLFRTEHAGALPYYIALVGTFLCSVLIGAAVHPPLGGDILLFVLTGGFYMLAMGFLVWALSRFAGSVVSELSSARAATFALFIVLAGLPTLALALSMTDWKSNPLASLWLLSPLLYNEPGAMMDAMARAGCLAASLGVIVFLAEQGRRRRG